MSSRLLLFVALALVATAILRFTPSAAGFPCENAGTHEGAIFVRGFWDLRPLDRGLLCGPDRVSGSGLTVPSIGNSSGLTGGLGVPSIRPVSLAPAGGLPTVGPGLGSLKISK